MTIEDKIKDEKLQYDTNREAKFTYSTLGKAFEKQTKTIEDQGEKQIKAIHDNKQQLINGNNYKDKLLY